MKLQGQVSVHLEGVEWLLRKGSKKSIPVIRASGIIGQSG